MAAANQSSIVSKCTRILDVLAEARRGLGFSEIVERSGFVKSSTHRVLAILVAERLAELDKRNRSYRLGPRLAGWALTAWRATDLQQIAATEMEPLCETTGYNVALAIRDEDAVLYLRTFDNLPVRYAAKVGEHAPLHCTAVGKVLLAFLPDRQREELLATLGLTRFTENTLTSRSALANDLATTRKRGYARNDREEFLQVCGIAAPVRDQDGQVVAAVSLWATVDRADLKTVCRCAPMLLATTARIAVRLGYAGD